jgi:hypothetical protein
LKMTDCGECFYCDTHRLPNDEYDSGCFNESLDIYNEYIKDEDCVLTCPCFVQKGLTKHTLDDMMGAMGLRRAK